MELSAGNCTHAQRLLNRAFQEVPEKSKSHVFLECARLEEFTGNLDCARQILERARVETKSEWKVFLESVLLEIRSNDWKRAAMEAQAALKVHSGAGRLWAVLVQLKQRDSDEAQQASLKQALKEVPKSGEVWCEGARIHLNPLSKAFDLETAGKYLGFAVQFTPQYGDSFMECLRLGLLKDLFLPRAQAIADARERRSARPAAPTAATTPELPGMTVPPTASPTVTSTVKPTVASTVTPTVPSTITPTVTSTVTSTTATATAAAVAPTSSVESPPPRGDRSTTPLGGGGKEKGMGDQDAPVGSNTVAGSRAAEAGGGLRGGNTGDSATANAAAAGDCPKSSPPAELRPGTSPQRTPPPPQLASPMTVLSAAHEDADRRRAPVSEAPSGPLLAFEVWAAIDAGKHAGTDKSHASTHPPASGDAIAPAPGAASSAVTAAESGGGGADKGGGKSVPVEAGSDGGGPTGGGGGGEGDGARKGHSSGRVGGGGRTDGGVVEKGNGGEVSPPPCSFELSEKEMGAAGRLSEVDFLRAEVEGLVLRCVNADPNYGSMWFHCRHRPSDTAKSILTMAKVMMADELTTLQDIYLNAVTRHVLLQREADAYIAATNPAEGGNASQGDGGREGMDTPRRRAGGGGSRVSRKREGKEERRDRLLAVAARIAPGVAFAHPEGSLKGIRAEDFVTGLASLNRITAQMGRLRSEDRRKILFGSDQIVP